ncbi:MAG: hypothetical protein AAGI14_01600 [Pseudomonadota bacterium]
MKLHCLKFVLALMPEFSDIQSDFGFRKTQVIHHVSKLDMMDLEIRLS